MGSGMKQYIFRETQFEKGYCSFALSIEKKGIESCYSDQMMKLLQQRGCNSLKELIEKL